nr:MAG TPA: hypothetical protein [Caudoviricetes sp.]
MINIETQKCAKLIDERTREIVKEICYKIGAEPIYNSSVVIGCEETNSVPDNNHPACHYLRGHCKLVIEIDLN